MNTDEYIEKMRKIQEKLLDYLESDGKKISLYDIFKDDKLLDKFLFCNSWQKCRNYSFT